MFSGLANQSEKGFDGSAEIFLNRNFADALCVASCFAIFVIHINKVDVARDIQLARAQLAHADHPKLCSFARCQHWRAVPLIQVMKCLLTSFV